MAPLTHDHDKCDPPARGLRRFITQAACEEYIGGVPRLWPKKCSACLYWYASTEP
jgi:hypothetical protein